MDTRYNHVIICKLLNFHNDIDSEAAVAGYFRNQNLPYWKEIVSLHESTKTNRDLPLIGKILFREEWALEEAKEENAALKEKINGLKQQYGPIGQQVYQSLKENIYLGLEGFLARKKVTS